MISVKKMGEINLSKGEVQIKGESTGKQQYNKYEHQKRKMKFIRQSFHGDFSEELKPTAEQIEQKKKRELAAEAEAKKTYEKRMRGWHTRKERGDF